MVHLLNTQFHISKFFLLNACVRIKKISSWVCVYLSVCFKKKGGNKTLPEVYFLKVTFVLFTSLFEILILLYSLHFNIFQIIYWFLISWLPWLLNLSFDLLMCFSHSQAWWLPTGCSVFNMVFYTWTQTLKSFSLYSFLSAHSVNPLLLLKHVFCF